jgi:hypothetical protein
MRAERLEDIVRTHFRAGASWLQLDLFFAASHSMDPGAQRFRWTAMLPRPAPRGIEQPSIDIARVGASAQSPMLDLIDAARSRRNGQPKAWQEWPRDAVAALPPVGAARRRADAGTAAPKGEISGLDPRAVFPREAALTRRIGGSLCRSIAPNRGSVPRSPLPRPIPVRSVSASKTGV